MFVHVCNECIHLIKQFPSSTMFRNYWTKVYERGETKFESVEWFYVWISFSLPSSPLLYAQTHPPGGFSHYEPLEATFLLAYRAKSFILKLLCKVNEETLPPTSILSVFHQAWHFIFTVVSGIPLHYSTKLSDVNCMGSGANRTWDVICAVD